MSLQQITANDIISISSAALDYTGSGNGAVLLPKGNTTQRPSTTIFGMMRYNTDLGCIEQYNNSGWQGVAPAPVVTGFSGIVNTDHDTTITVLGSNFTSGSVITINGPSTSNISRTLITSYVSSTQLTANTQSSVTNYVGGTYFNLIVTNPTGLSSVITNAGIVDRDTVWVTPAGNIGTIYDAVVNNNITLNATDADGNVTYSLISGSLPPGLTLNSANGVITGTSNTTVSSPTTYTITVGASNSGISIPRTFNIIVTPARDGSTSARATTPYYLRNTLGLTTNGTYWVNTTSLGQTSAIQSTINFGMVDSKDWVLMTWINQSSTNTGSLVGTDWLGNSVPFTGFCLEWGPGNYYYSYWSSNQTYNVRGTSTLGTGGNYSGYQLFLGQAGGMGWYNSGQAPCNWGNSTGSIGAGYDGSCGTYPTTLRMGTGTSSASYSLTTGQIKFWIYMGSLV